MRVFQVEGLSGWMQSARFDIVATAGRAPLPAAEMSEMLRNLLEDRFQLRVHHETRESPLYKLVLADPKKLVGPDIHASTLDCAEYRKQLDEWRRQLRPDPPAMKPCGVGGSLNGATGEFVARYGGVTIPEFADHISDAFLQRVLIDETGLTGEFDIAVKVAADSVPWYTPPPGGSVPASAAPSIFAAFPEQLGLKLEAGRGPVDILVVDHAEPPTPN
jgi:uncharacterized protein (TIGR03435 family)